MTQPDPHFEPSKSFGPFEFVDAGNDGLKLLYHDGREKDGNGHLLTMEDLGDLKAWLEGRIGKQLQRRRRV